MIGRGGHWDLFQKAAKSSFILWNGSVALTFIPGQPQRRISFATDVFSACTVPPISGLGAFHRAVKNLCCGLLKEIPMAPDTLFQKSKLIPNMVDTRPEH